MIKELTIKDILEEAPEGAEEYVYETVYQMAGYLKNNREAIYIPEEHELGWQHHEPYWIDENDVVINLKEVQYE